MKSTHMFKPLCSRASMVLAGASPASADETQLARGQA